MTQKEYALKYLSMGISVIPCRVMPSGRIKANGELQRDEKKALVEWAKYQTELPTPEDISRWWDTWPDAAIAAITGKLSGFLVVDAEKEADFSLFGLDEIGGPTVETGGGGRHFYCAYEPGIRNSTKFTTEYDIRGEGGYAILPPSGHESGGRYTWLIPLGSVELPPFPQKVKELISQWERNEKRMSEIIMEHAPEGSRNDRATSVCGKLLLNFAPHEWDGQAWPLLQAWNETHAKPPLDNSELQNIFKSISRKEGARRTLKLDIGEPTIETMDDAYTIGIPLQDAFIHFTVINVNTNAHELEIDLTCVLEKAKEKSCPLTFRVNLLSISARESMCRQMRDAFGKEFSWGQILSKMVSSLQKTLSVQNEVKFAGDFTGSPPTFILPGLVEERAVNIFFGSPGTGKTTLVMDLGVSLATGKPFLGIDPAGLLKPLFIDYESNGETWQKRLFQLLSRVPADPSEIKNLFGYFNPKGAPFNIIKQHIKELIVKHGFTALIIDSAVAACGNHPEDAGLVTNFMETLASLDTTILLIAHQTKEQKEDFPFGSVFFHANARNTWLVKPDGLSHLDGAIGVQMVHKKCNNGPLTSLPIYGLIRHGIEEIIITREPSPTNQSNISDQILHFISAQGGCNKGDIMDGLNMKENTVKQTLQRLQTDGKVSVKKRVWSVI